MLREKRKNYYTMSLLLRRLLGAREKRPISSGSNNFEKNYLHLCLISHCNEKVVDISFPDLRNVLLSLIFDCLQI